MYICMYAVDQQKTRRELCVLMHTHTTSLIYPFYLLCPFHTHNQLFFTDRLRDLEKKTGQPKAIIALAIFAIINFVIFSLGGTKLMSDIFAFAYPAYQSFKAIDSENVVDDTQWLTYWVVFSLVSIVENLGNFLISWIPFYYMIKCAFFLWLYHPKFMGAGLVYKQVVK